MSTLKEIAKTLTFQVLSIEIILIVFCFFALLDWLQTSQFYQLYLNFVALTN